MTQKINVQADLAQINYAKTIIEAVQNGNFSPEIVEKAKQINLENFDDAINTVGTRIEVAGVVEDELEVELSDVEISEIIDKTTETYLRNPVTYDIILEAFAQHEPQE